MVMQPAGVVDVTSAASTLCFFFFLFLTIQSTATFLKSRNKQKNNNPNAFFSFPFEINSFFFFIDQQAEVGQETNKQKKKCYWAGFERRWSLSHSSRSSFKCRFFFSIICYKKR